MRNVLLITLLLSPTLFVACSTKVKKEVRKLENNFDDFRSFYQQQASTIEGLEETVRALQGRVEELEYAQQQLLGSEVTSIRESLASLKRRVPPPAVVPSVALDSAEASAQALPSEISENVKNALGKIREGSFEEAIPLLEDSLSRSEGKSFSAELLFWLGVAHDGLEHPREALTAYNEIVSNYTQSPLVPASLLRQAGVFERLEDTKAYTLALQKLIKDYPRSPEAQSARAKLGER
jgi:TolA-binding protein